MLIGISFKTFVRIHAMKNPNMRPNTAADRFLIENLLMNTSTMTMRINEKKSVSAIINRNFGQILCNKFNDILMIF